MEKLIPVDFIYSQAIAYDEQRRNHITIETTKFDDKTLKPIKWAIRSDSRTSMSKVHGQFAYEPLPSSRDNSFMKEFRFNSPEQAKKCFYKFHPDLKPKENATKRTHNRTKSKSSS